MIISEKQINELIMIGHVYLRILEDLARIDETFLSSYDNHNKIYVAQLLMEIVNQQSTTLKNVE